MYDDILQCHFFTRTINKSLFFTYDSDCNGKHIKFRGKGIYFTYYILILKKKNRVFSVFSKINTV